MIASRASQMLRAELWDPYLDAAIANNEPPPALPRSDIYLWIGNVGKMLMRGLDDGDATSSAIGQFSVASSPPPSPAQPHT
jgi:hypothetical protein